MVIFAATFCFVGMAMTFSIMGHLKRQWWFSTVGALVWLVVGFWWVTEGVDTLYGMVGGYTDIIYYLPFMLVVFVLADIINYWNTVEQQVVGKGYSYQLSGPKPLSKMPSSYESYREELQRRTRITRRRAGS